MRNECNIIRDILPLHIDKIVSEDTISFVEEHLEKCAACRTELEKMKTPNALEQATFDAPTDDEKPLQIFAKKWNRKKRIVISAFAAILLIVVLLGSCFVSYLKFDTANPFAAAGGFIQITVAGKDYVEIQHAPQVILAQPSNALFIEICLDTKNKVDQFIEYMESRGFTENAEENLGGLRVFTNGEEKEWILYSQNAYFSKWTWQ